MKKKERLLARVSPSVLDRFIMASFFPEFKAKTIKEIMERTGYSYERVYHGLKGFKDEGLVSDRKVGKTLLFSPVKEKALWWYNAFVDYNLKRNMDFHHEYPTASAALSELSSLVTPITMIVFGSYARFQAREGSDLDVICVFKGKEKDLHRKALSLRHIYNIPINPIPLTVKQFKRLKQENINLFEDIRESSIVLNDLSLFFRIMYGGG